MEGSREGEGGREREIIPILIEEQGSFQCCHLEVELYALPTHMSIFIIYTHPE